MFKQLYIDWFYINRNCKALVISLIMHIIIFTGILLFWSEKTIVETQKMQISLTYLEPVQPITEIPVIEEKKIIEENIPVKTEVEKSITAPPEKPAPKPQPKNIIKPAPERIPAPVTAPQRQRNVRPPVKKEPVKQPLKERVIIERQPKNEFDLPIADLTHDFERPDIEYKSEKPLDIISDRSNIISEKLLTEHTPAARNDLIFEYEELNIIKPDRNIIINDIIRQGINLDRDKIIEFDKLNPVNTEKPEFISRAFYITEKSNVPARKLLKSPDMPAPDWLEEKGISTNILFDGIVNEHGRLVRADIIQMSPYYKLDIAARDFVMKNWLWERVNYSQQVRIQLVVFLKKGN